MNPQFSLKFFIIGGVILIVCGVAQTLLRLCFPVRGKPARRTIGDWARTVMFVMVGVLSIMVGMGAIPIGGR